ncbi:unnamed protein product [Acanthoscelides obtectus]|uniref:Uncharacterized protein n=1 Tax=Acanthoscelides obtectus TaxID=200917 RepID=A0A9P0VV54_ACAOB|nr:unnamed protein product [Acanthoscelides obtectus]CAK1684677.1 hypothetical protein AOBTE_LOCUS35023 [Acanthoscelides obtectus]
MQNCHHFFNFDEYCLKVDGLSDALIAWSRLSATPRLRKASPINSQPPGKVFSTVDGIPLSTASGMTLLNETSPPRFHARFVVAGAGSCLKTTGPSTDLAWAPISYRPTGWKMLILGLFPSS